MMCSVIRCKHFHSNCLLCSLLYFYFVFFIRFNCVYEWDHLRKDVHQKQHHHQQTHFKPVGVITICINSGFLFHFFISFIFNVLMFKRIQVEAFKTIVVIMRLSETCILLQLFASIQLDFVVKLSRLIV